MRLMEYLRRERLTYAAFANRIGTRHARTVQRYVQGSSRPSGDMIQAIIHATGGEVTANDFFDLGEAPTAADAQA